METRPALTFFAAILALSSVMPVRGGSFVHSPETRAPVWSSSFPYQRDIDMKFNVSPVAPPGPGGIPGASYAGTLDSALKGADQLTFGGSTQWFPAGTVFIDGAVGVSNPGTGVLTGTATVTLGGMRGQQPLYLWVELLYFAGIGTSVDVSVASPGATYSVTPLGAEVGGVLYPTGLREAVFPVNGAGISRFVCEYEISPAPTNAQLVLSFSASRSDFCHMASALEVHVATHTDNGLPPRLEAPKWLAGNAGFQLTVVGQPGGTYEIQSSETLTNWTPVGSVSTPQGTNSFTDPTAVLPGPAAPVAAISGCCNRPLCPGVSQHSLSIG